MSAYFLSPQAVSDLTNINDYLFAGNQAAADTFLDEISQTFERLARFPQMGRRRDELSPLLRSFPFQVYLIFGVYILVSPRAALTLNPSPRAGEGL